MTQDLERLRSIKSFTQLVKYLRDELDLPPKPPGNVRYQGLKRSSKSRRNR
jgi:hypothetical protein